MGDTMSSRSSHIDSHLHAAGKATDAKHGAATDGTRPARITVESLTKIFQRTGGERVHAVAGISLAVMPGEMLVLLGPSGCGKTTLLRCIAGLETPVDGEIWLDNRLVYSAAKHVNVMPEKRNISMMFQSYAVWPHMTVEENVAFPLRGGRRHEKKQIVNRVREIVDIVGLKNLYKQYPGQLSGGQQQRVALARSLVVEPNVVLFDEPLSNVDAKVREELRSEISARQRQFDFAGVYVTHDQAEALQLADRIAVLQEGKVVQIGTPDEVYRMPQSRYVANFIGVINEVPATAGNSTAARTDLVAANTPLGPIHGMRESLPAGDQTRFVAAFRPEAVMLSTEPTSGANVIAGEVVSSVFCGSYRDYYVRANDHTLRVSSQGYVGATSLADGTQIWLQIPPENVVFYAE